MNSKDKNLAIWLRRWILLICLILSSRAGGQGRIEIHLDTGARETKAYWDSFFANLAVTADSKGGVVVGAEYCGYDKYERKGTFVLLRIPPDQIAKLSISPVRGHPYVVWPSAVEFKTHFIISPYEGSSLVHIDDFLNYRKQELQNLLRKGEFDLADLQLEIIIKIYEQLGASVDHLGAKARWHHYNVRKNALEAAFRYCHGRAFSRLDENSKRARIDLLDGWYFALMEGLLAEFHLLNQEGNTLDKDVDAAVARLLQVSSLWMDFTQSPALGGLGRGWPEKSLTDETLEFPGTMDQASKDAFRNDLVSLWSILTSDQLSAELTMRAEKNLTVAGLPEKVRKGLEAFAAFSEEDDVQLVPLASIEKSVDALRWIFPDKAVMGEMARGP